MRVPKWKLLASLAVVALAIGIVASSVFAAPPTPVPPANSAPADPPYGFGYGMMGGYNLDRVAKLLGMTRADVANELQQGKALAQIAQSKGVTEQQLIDNFIGPFKDQLQLRVKYEFITQQQADSLLQQMIERVKASINATTANGYVPGAFCGPGACNGLGPGACGGPGAGMMGGFGGCGGQYNNGGTAAPANNGPRGFGRGMMGRAF